MRRNVDIVFKITILLLRGVGSLPHTIRFPSGNTIRLAGNVGEGYPLNHSDATHIISLHPAIRAKISSFLSGINSLLGSFSIGFVLTLGLV